MGAATGQANISEFGIPEGSFSVKDKIISSCAAQTLDTIEVSNTGLVLHGTLTGQGCTVNYPLTFTPIAANQLQFKLQLEGAGAAAINRIYLHGASEADEHFFGFGGQLTDFDQN
ncbi:MAG: hypothetical protein V7L20_09970 [Nostoc sp.]|uniref:hypothetical protein n=1 Tax=Nostoc sp. TaxID=1180 RepID=UPI002FF5293E